MRRLSTILILLLGLSCLAVAQDTGISDTLGVEVEVYFRKGDAKLDPNFRGNGERLRLFSERLRVVVDESTVRMGGRITASCSPEGTLKYNRELSEKRSSQIKDLVMRYSGLEERSIMISSYGVDWRRLARMVESCDEPWRGKALDIIRNVPESISEGGRVIEERRRQLELLDGGSAWDYMEDHFFEDLRRSFVSIAVVRYFPGEDADEDLDVEMIRVVPPVLAATPERPAEIAVEPEPAPADRPPFRMALKTNMLYDVALVPNVGVEFHLGSGWTVGANFMYSWWNSTNWMWRTGGAEVDFRKYFGRRHKRNPMTGHHLGIYGQALTYDVQVGSRGYLGGKSGGGLLEKMSWGAGIEYGYSLPVARKLNIDFGIGVGYLGGEYNEYDRLHGHAVWRATRMRHWVGPTKAEISLVWLIGKGNVNERRGGRL